MMIHPPSLNFGAFHSTHFADPDKRAYFSQLIAQDPQSAAWTAALAPAAPHQHTAAVETRADEAATTDADAVEDVADVLPGETDEQWQERHGFSYLTPAGVRIFDAARVFREQREAEDAAEAEAAREATAKLEDIEDAIRNRVATPLSGSSSAHVASSDEAMEVDTLATSPSAPTTRSIQLSDELVALRARALSARRQARNEVAEADKSEET